MILPGASFDFEKEVVKGTLVGPKGGSQIFQQWDKDAQGELTHHNLMGVIYIPLTDAEAQLNDSD